MNTYEALFILDTAGKEESVDALVDRVSGTLTEEGAKVEKVEKLEKRNFARVANRKHPSGYYVNYTFTAAPDALDRLQTKYKLDNQVFRVTFTRR